jgi:hypothetical protein
MFSTVDFQAKIDIPGSERYWLYLHNYTSVSVVFVFNRMIVRREIGRESLQEMGKGTTLRKMRVNVKTPLCVLRTFAKDEDELLASRPGRFNPGEGASIVGWTGGRLGWSQGQSGRLGKRKFWPLPE